MDQNFRMIRDATRCISCYECIIVCPQSAEGMKHKVLRYPAVLGTPPEVDAIQNCLQCMTCWDICRAHAIQFENHHQIIRLVENEKMLAKIAKII